MDAILSDTRTTSIFVPEQSSTANHDLGCGVSLQWWDNGQIAVFDVPPPIHAAVDIYIDTLTAIIESWSPDKPLLVATISLSEGSAVTPYLRSRLDDMLYSPAAERITARFAVIIRKGLFNRIARIFLQLQVMKGSPAHLPTNLYFDMEEAFNWLREALESPAEIQDSI